MKRYILIPIVVIFLLAPKLGAQILPGGSVMAPGAPPAMIGVELGLGEHTQVGAFQASCGCNFETGSGSGFLGGLLFDLPLDYDWTVGIAVKFDFKSMGSTTNVRDTAVITFNNSNGVESGYLWIQRDGAVKETFLTLNPFVRYEFARGAPFIQIGPGIGFLLSSSFVHKRTLTSSSITYTDFMGVSHSVDNVRFQNGTQEEQLQSGAIERVSGTRISAIATLGWNLSLSDNAVIAPMISYDFPFTLIRPDSAAGPDGSQNWKISSLYFSVGLKYKLGE